MKYQKHKAPSFATFAECLSPNLSQTLRNIVKLERMNAIIYAAFPHLREVCHCGAIDYENELLVIYTADNAAYYSVNNYLNALQECLERHGCGFDKILLKTNPRLAQIKHKPQRKVAAAEYAMLAKFAAAIDRFDLLKPADRGVASDASNDWQLDL